MRQVNETAIPTQTGAAINSAPIPARNLLYGSVQAVSASGEVGTLTIQVSNDDPNTTNNTPTNFATLSTLTISGTGVFVLPTFNICYEYIRLVYAHTSGSGTIAAVFKGLGE